MNKIFEATRVIIGVKKPHVCFFCLRFTNMQLLMRRELVGKQVILSVNPDDIRTLDVRLKNGQRLGSLEIMRHVPNFPLQLDDHIHQTQKFMKQSHK